MLARNRQPFLTSCVGTKNPRTRPHGKHLITTQPEIWAVGDLVCQAALLAGLALGVVPRAGVAVVALWMGLLAGLVALSIA